MIDFINDMLNVNLPVNADLYAGLGYVLARSLVGDVKGMLRTICHGCEYILLFYFFCYCGYFLYNHLS